MNWEKRGRHRERRTEEEEGEETNKSGGTNRAERGGGELGQIYKKWKGEEGYGDRSGEGEDRGAKSGRLKRNMGRGSKQKNGGRKRQEDKRIWR